MNQDVGFTTSAKKLHEEISHEREKNSNTQWESPAKDGKELFYPSNDTSDLGSKNSGKKLKNKKIIDDGDS